MVFNSFAFVIFFVAICIIMAVTNVKFVKNSVKLKKIIIFRQIILLTASYFFYGWWNINCCFIMLGMTVVCYICSRCIEKWGRMPCVIGVVIPLMILGVFKYYNFFISSFCTFLGITSVGALNIILPVGISFYTFQSLSYTIDVYRKRIPAEKSFLKIALYIAFFPQLVAGPIVKSKDFLSQLHEDRNINLSNLSRGVQIFTFGLCKKIVIADNISVFVDDVFGCPKEYCAISIILAVFAYSIQIYCDFSGYSDMAIGCAKCLGYDLRKNFNLPYLSINIIEFWKRWHISLSSWLQEYLYIPLGGNRKGKIRTYFNNFFTMLIGGLWHGASWTFIVWGALHGMALCVCKAFRGLLGREKKYNESIVGKIISVVITYLFVCFCWIFFRADDFEIAWEIICGIFTWQKGVLWPSTWSIFAIIVTMICYAVAIFKGKIEHETQIDGFYPILNLNSFWGLTVYFTALGLIMGFAYTGNNPFIYFQF